MIRLHLHGIGSCGLGTDQPYTDGFGALENIPIKEYAKANVRRRFGRLAKLVYIAAARAIEDAGADPGELAIILATAMGETTVSVDLLRQIHDTKGALIRPSLVPNSVHNSPAGYLGIGLGNHQPSVTISQGWLSAESALVTAADLIQTGTANRALVIAGDEANPSWMEQLEEVRALEWSAALAQQRFQEGVVALVVGSQPGTRELGTVIADTRRVERPADGIGPLLERNQIELNPTTAVRVREGAGGSGLRSMVAAATGLSPEQIALDGPGRGTAQAGAFAVLAECVMQNECDDLLLVGSEVDELALLNWRRRENR